MDKRVKFDFEIYFTNGGNIKGEDFRLDIMGESISDEELADYIVKDLRLLMVGETKILNKEIITEPHKRSPVNQKTDPALIIDSNPAIEHGVSVIDKETAAHSMWGDHCDNWVLADTDGLSVKQESMPAGAIEALHFHNHAQQFFFVLNGTATFYIENKKLIVAAQKGLLIQPKIKHYVANETDEKLDFLVISQPTTNNDRTIV
jgi:mannose-6-phosphate isomerase-like protein (cupin superfamily)